MLNENPALQMETLSLLGLMSRWAKGAGAALDRKPTGAAIADSLKSAMHSLQRLPLAPEDVQAAGRDVLAAKEAIEILLKLAHDKDDSQLGNQVLRLVLGFNALGALHDLLQLETGVDIFSKRKAEQKRENPLDQLRRMFGGPQED